MVAISRISNVRRIYMPNSPSRLRLPSAPSRRMAPPASAFYREAERSGQALRRAHLSERSEFAPFSLNRLRSRQNGADGVLSFWYLFLSYKRKKKYIIIIKK